MSQPPVESESESALPGRRSPGLADLAWTFLKLGTIGFGGPAAHIAMMEDELVTRRGWLKREEFLDLIGAANLIPGPTSTEVAIHVGYSRGGLRGLVVAGSCFILPAALLVLATAWAYVRFGELPAVEGALYGIKPVLIAVVVQALWRLGRTAIKGPLLGGAAVVAAVLNFAGVHELAVLFGGAVAVAIVRSFRTRRPGAGDLLPLGAGSLLSALASKAASTSSLASGEHLALTGAAVATGATIAKAGLGAIFLVFLKIGSVLFGSGYVLLAFLQADLVERLGWLTRTQLLDAVAVGQITPGPLFTTATFIGYLLGGFPGAVAATLGIFLPAFFFVAVSAPFIHKMRRSPLASRFLDGLNATSLALMAVVTWQLFRAAVPDLVTAALALASAVLLLRYQVHSAWLVLGGAAAGLLVRGLT